MKLYLQLGMTVQEGKGRSLGPSHRRSHKRATSKHLTAKAPEENAVIKHRM